MKKGTNFFSFFLATLALVLLPVKALSLPLPVSQKDIVGELIALKDKNSALQKEVSLLDHRLNTIDDNLVKLNDQITDTEFNLNKEIRILSQRAKAMYKDENNQMSLQLILESKSIYELITRLDFFSLILKQDLKMVNQTKINRQKLITLKRNYIAKRQKIVLFKQEKQKAMQEHKVVRLKLRQRLKKVSRQQLNQVNAGLDTAKFYNDYLGAKNSPMAGLGTTLVTAGRQYGISPDLVIAISGVESSFGVHNAGAYNAWGRKAKGGGYESFSSWQEAIINQNAYLRQKYFNIGLTTPETIGRKYAPGNGRWPGKVRYFLGDIKAYRLSHK